MSDILAQLAGLYATSPGLFTATVGIVGLLVGSFLNVVIHRVPLMLEREWKAQAAELLMDGGASGPAGTTTAPAQPAAPFNLVTPPSRCPSCGAPIRPWQNIPVISWLLLRGRCHGCAAPISVRYPLVELLTAVLSGWIAWHFGVTVQTLCALGVTWSLIALTGIDIDTQYLPDWITLPLLWAGLVAAVVLGPVAGLPLPVSPRDAILGAAAGYLSLWLVFHAFRLLTGKEGMGYGDFKLFAALGAWLGPGPWGLKLLLVILLSAGTGAVLGIAMIVLRGRDRAAPMPFGPYLATAGFIAMLYGDSILTAYLQFSGPRR